MLQPHHALPEAGVGAEKVCRALSLLRAPEHADASSWVAKAAGLCLQSPARCAWLIWRDKGAQLDRPALTTATSVVRHASTKAHQPTT
jgi:hypothetical protein